MNQPSTLKERILQYAQVHLGAEPEHLWAKFPRYAVLRHSENAKWFAVFLEFPGTRLGLERPESVDILDVKWQLFGAGREKRLYAIPPYTDVESLDFEDYPFTVQSWDEACAICGSTDTYLDEVILDDQGNRMFVCSDTDCCARRALSGLP